MKQESHNTIWHKRWKQSGQIQHLREGDPLVWEQFVDDFGPRIHRYFRNAASRDMADDLTSEVFCAVVAQLPQFREDASLNTWLYAICRNLLYKRLGFRRRWQDALQRAVPFFSHNPTLDPETAYLRKDALAHVASAMTTLPTLYREVLTLRHIEEFPIKEVAIILNISESQVKNIARAAKKKLFQTLENVPHTHALWHRSQAASMNDEERSA